LETIPPPTVPPTSDHTSATQTYNFYHSHTDLLYPLGFKDTILYSELLPTYPSHIPPTDYLHNRTTNRHFIFNYKSGLYTLINHLDNHQIHPRDNLQNI
jgi:hypothetical protein